MLRKQNLLRLRDIELEKTHGKLSKTIVRRTMNNYEIPTVEEGMVKMSTCTEIVKLFSV